MVSEVSQQFKVFSQTATAVIKAINKVIKGPYINPT